MIIKNRKTTLSQSASKSIHLCHLINGSVKKNSKRTLRSRSIISSRWDVFPKLTSKKLDKTTRKSKGVCFQHFWGQKNIVQSNDMSNEYKLLKQMESVVRILKLFERVWEWNDVESLNDQGLIQLCYSEFYNLIEMLSLLNN